MLRLYKNQGDRRFTKYILFSYIFVCGKKNKIIENNFVKNNTNSKGVNLVMFYINLKSILGKMRLHALTLLYNIFEPMDRDDGGGELTFDL